MNGPDGKWIGWGLKESSPTIRVAKQKLKAKFSYAKTLDDTEYFGEDLLFALKTYQARKDMDGYLPVLRVDGVLDYATQIALGVVVKAPAEKPMLFTVAGTYADWMFGYPADIARRVLDLYQWQPIGYPAAAFPMQDSINKGVEELRKQIRIFLPRGSARQGAFCGYSQGGVVVSSVLKHDIMDPAGEFHYLWEQKRITKGVTLGNPDRELGKANGNKAAGWPVPEGRGITFDRLENTPDWWYDYAHGANSPWGRDIYTDVPVGDTGDNMSSVWPIVASVDFSVLFKRIFEMFADPTPQFMSAVWAVVYAGAFFTANPPTLPHVNYQIEPAVQYLRRVASM